MAMPSSRQKGSPSISMRSEKVPESPSSALQTTYFCAAARRMHGAPLDAGRKGRATAPAQARIGHGRTIAPAPWPAPGAGPRRRRARRSRPASADRPRRRGGTGAAGAPARESPRSGRGTAHGRRRRGNRRRTGRANRPTRHRAVGDATLRRGHFDQRLQPDHAARTVAHQAHRCRARPPRRRWPSATASAPRASAAASPGT
jgi:hypothetical protein